MTHGLLNWKRVIALSTVLTALAVSSAVLASAAETTDDLKPKQMEAVAAGSKTPAEHMCLARHYTAMAARHEAEAEEHEALVAEYTKNPRMGSSKHPMAPNTAEHCKFYAEHCRNAAKQMRAMAAAHEEMAKESER